jgi:hypothetical protein
MKKFIVLCIVSILLLGLVNTDRIEFSDPDNAVAAEMYLSESPAGSDIYDLTIGFTNLASELIVRGTTAIDGELIVSGNSNIGASLGVVEDIVVWGDVIAGRLFADGFSQINGDLAVIGDVTANNLGGSVYTPELTNVLNLDSSTPYELQYMRTWGTVTVSGRISVNPTAVSTLTQVGISIPIPSNFTSEGHCAGTGASVASSYSETGVISANTTYEYALLSFHARIASNHYIYFQFTYQIR